MSNFQTQCMYILEKEELGVVFGKCFRHKKNPEFLVGLRKSENSEYIETEYKGTDKNYADNLYFNLVSERKKKNLENS